MEFVGDYELLEIIAEGGMGTVHKARHRTTAALVAIKILPPHLAKNPVLLKRFEKEYNAAKSLDHPNVVRALAFGYHRDSPFLVMEFVAGESLGDRLEREGALPEPEAIHLITQVANGLQKAHKVGLIHRDVKPDNILLTPAGVAKLADLGLVKELDTDLNLTRTGRGLGTPHFMSPEQFRNAKHVDARSDIYSLGATLYMVVTGEMPFKQLGPVEVWAQKVDNKYTSVRDVVPELSERIDWAIRRAMQADPSQRPASCREFVEDLTGHSTRPLTSEIASGREIWFLRFKDASGASHTAQESLMSVRRALKDGLLGDPTNIRASRNQTGPFEPLRKLPEFRDLILAAELAARPPEPGRRPTPTARTMSPLAAKGNLQPSARETPRPSSGETSKPRRPALPAAPAALPTAFPQTLAEPSAAPHFHLGSTGPRFDWGRVLLFLLLALVAAAAGFFLLPQLLR